MKFFTEKQFQKFLEECARRIEEANKEGFETGYDKGYEIGQKDGYSKGLHEGLTHDKKGVILNASGIYAFENEATKVVNS
ncbi:hypothetical protein [Metabacillus sp. Hm71]|uniref:hypothetical protein n=1 Tax=Metabacillus sp. Hm71 TaxID=3450743 RepID=UPI003F43EC77